MGLKPLGYRTWAGKRKGAGFRFWPIARSSLVVILRRKIFWIFLLFFLLNFLFASGLIYFVAQLEGQLGMRLPFPNEAREEFLFTGTGTAYQKFIAFQGPMVMMMLALAGSLLVGNDFRTNALTFYLSKPIGKLDYFLGKFLAAFTLPALVTLVPALILFVEFGAYTESLDYYADHLHVLAAIIAHGVLVCSVMSVLLLGVSSLLKKTIPILLTWGGIFVFLPAVAGIIRMAFEERNLPGYWYWGLLDIWSDLRWISSVLYQVNLERYGERWPYAVLVLAALCFLSLFAFWRRISAVEVVR